MTIPAGKKKVHQTHVEENEATFGHQLKQLELKVLQNSRKIEMFAGGKIRAVSGRLSKGVETLVTKSRK